MTRKHGAKAMRFWGVLCDAFVLAVLLTAMIHAGGCDSRPAAPPTNPPTPPSIPAPAFDIPGGFDPNKPVEARYVVEGPTAKSTEQATGTGAGLTTNSDEAAAQFDTSAPGANLPGIGSTGGSLSSRVTFRTLQSAASNPLLWVGIVAVLAAGVTFYLGLRRASLICVAIGGGFIAAAMIPGWGWFVLAAAALLGVGVYVYVEYGAKRTTSALQAVVDGVAATKETAPDAYTAVKREIGKQATATDRRVIDQRKASSDTAPAN